MTDVNNTDDIIDSRDVIARIEELEDMYDEEAFEDNLDDDERDELLDLKTLAEEAENCCDWQDGVTLISDNYFEQYAENYARDIGAISNEHRWPLDCIDWEKAADDLKVDFSSVDFDGVTFWVNG